MAKQTDTKAENYSYRHTLYETDKNTVWRKNDQCTHTPTLQFHLYRVEGKWCHPFNSRGGRLKGPRNIYCIQCGV